MRNLAFVDGRAAALGGLIDYAGSFPPAALPTEAAVAEYRAARAGPHGFVLGRFVAAASRLEALAGELTATMARGEAPWRLSVLLDGGLAAAVSQAQTFAAHMSAAADVALVEVRAPDAVSDGRPAEHAADLLSPIATAATAVGPDVTAFVEIPMVSAWKTGLGNAVEALGRLDEHRGRLGAKLRTGGPEPGAFPSVEQVARFIVACREAGLPFKATAGLHQPIRRFDADLGAARHGFLNVLAATALADTGADERTVRDVVGDTDTAAFQLDASGLRWRDRRVGVGTVRTVRARRFPSYGSCSFDEPVRDLISLGFLEPG
jgi:hypothetical protein